MKRKEKFRPTQMVEPIQPCAIDVDGIPYNFNPGHSRVRADHPAVQSNPDLFKALDNESEDEKRGTA